MILLITNKEDITTDFIVNKLNKIGYPYYRLNTEDLVQSIDVNLNLSENYYYLFDNRKNKEIDLTSIKSVYYRRPKLPRINYTNLSYGENNFVLSEINLLIEGIYKLLINAFWINPVYKIREAENKIYQLLIAKKLHFTIPNSLITTLEVEAKKFINRFDFDCIVKPIKSGFIEENLEESQLVFTSLITDHQIETLGRVKACPTFFQNNIRKFADIRVTIVGDKVYSTIIHSQEFDSSIIDWRKSDTINIKHEQHSLPKKLERMCIGITKYLGLTFSAIDLILDEKDNYYFLEINPNGQWGWIEKRVGYEISQEIVNLLMVEN